MTCQICNRRFNSLGGLHGHIKKMHGRTQEDYYYDFNPRYDLYDHELIAYKSLEQYLKTDFNSRENFLEWFTENYKNPRTKEYCMGKLLERAQRKNYFYLPSQVELKSLYLPSLLGFEKLYGSIPQFLRKLQEVNIVPKFNYACDWDLNKSPIKIFVDSREQHALKLSCETEVIKVPCGDYFPSEPHFANVFAERKSLSDLAGTLGCGLERFVRELEKAKELGFYIVVIVEDLYSDALSYSSTNRYSKKINGHYIFHTLRDLSARFPMQFLFCGNRKRAADIVEKIFRLGSQAINIDLELAKDKGEL